MRSARPSIEPRLNKSHFAALWGLDFFFVCIVLHFQDHLIISGFPRSCAIARLVKIQYPQHYIKQNNNDNK